MPNHPLHPNRPEPKLSSNRERPARYAVDLPKAIAAAYACWESLDRAVPLEPLLEAASSQLRGAAERGEPARLDLLRAVLRLRTTIESGPPLERRRGDALRSRGLASPGNAARRTRRVELGRVA